MTQSGSKPRRLRNAIVAMVVAAVIAALAWTQLRSSGVRDVPPQAAAVATAAASGISANDAAGASKPTKKLKNAATDASLPPPGTPLAQTYKDLKSRADAGDVAAASRLFRDVYRCALAKEYLLSVPAYAALLVEGDTSKLSADELSRRERRLADLQTHLGEMREQSKNCEGLDETQLLVIPIMLEAARLGDSTAGICYVEGSLISDPKLFDHPEWLTEYKSSALALARASTERGEWGAVAQLQHAYARDGYGGLLLGRILTPDPVQNYRYLKLRRLGANGENAPYYDRDLAFVAHGLSADEIAAGDAWAQDTYLRYFSAAPENTVGAHNSPLCPDPNE